MSTAIALQALAALGSLIQGLEQSTPPRVDVVKPPWVVIDQPRVEKYGFLGDPQFAALANGTYLACAGNQGHWTVNGTDVYRSTDQGRTWNRVAEALSIWAANLVAVKDRPYLVGVESTGRAGGG